MMNSLKNFPRIGVLLAACCALAFATRLDAATSVSQFGITWTFDRDYTTGQFANGDYWVVGPVRITGISPASTTSGGRTMNGSMINPAVGGAQGYDSATYDTYGPNFNASLNVAAGVSTSAPLLVPVGSSLVSTISNSAAGNRPQLTDAAILTVLAAAAPAGSFRPPHVGTNKQLRWNVSQLNYSLLRSLAPVSGTPSMATVAGYFDRPWLEQNTTWLGRYQHPSNNMPDYGRDLSLQLADGMLMLHLNYSNTEKETLLIRMVQYGIDVYGTAVAGGLWEDNGGHGQGRKMPMLLAGMVLGDSEILAYGNAATHFIFQDDRQTFRVAQSDVGRALYHDDGRSRVEYIQADVGLGEWGEKHASSPDRDGRNWDAHYRGIVGQSILGHVLVAQLMGAKATWNWDPLFDYMDRYWEIEKDITGSSTALSTFHRNMWASYRSLAGSPPVVDPTQAATPMITPYGGVFLNPVSVSMSSATTGAAIYYTLDGSTPTTGSTRYTAAFTLSNSATVRAFATASGFTNSAVRDQTFEIGQFTAGTTWRNISVAAQTSSFSLAFVVTPQGTNVDGVVGLSNGAVAAYASLATIVRFGPTGVIDARNGSAYAAVSALSYTANTAYAVSMTVDVANHRYSATVTPSGGSAVTIADNYAFRTEQAAVTTIDNVAMIATAGAMIVSNIQFGSTVSLPVPPGTLTLQ